MANAFVISYEEEKKLQKNFDDAYSEFREQLKSPNILLLGQTGVGKSSLVNTVFGAELAQVSHTKPETRGFHRYNSPNVPVNIIDSEGYELSADENGSSAFVQSVDKYIQENFADLTKQIHIAWYCVSLSSARVLPYDLDNLEFLLKKKNIPTCVVITQCDNDTPDGATAKAMSSVVYQRFGRDIPCFQVSNDVELNKDLDVEKLIKWSSENIKDENLKLGFLVAQKADLKLKEEKVQSRIKYYTVAAAGIGASPIPMSDALLLTGLQVKMVADIFSIYGLDASTASIVRAVVQGKIVSTLGKTLVGNLLKWIPGLGTAAGAAINATVASGITYAMGYAFNKLTKIAVENAWEGRGLGLEKIFTSENINMLIDEYNKNKNNGK